MLTGARTGSKRPRLDFYARRAVLWRSVRTDRACRALPAVAALVLCGAMAIGARVWIATLPARWSLESYDRFLIFTPFQVHLGRALAERRIPLGNPLLGFGIYEA